eukprot:TRINITY_DN94686_c0_g1_i1.p2 TRINITY_DN94686_c0_g1~~TRINITY_DN94686_c0_g1_i1.p2  ORF type:complete len:270 (+),score=74.99 TRINITY_DN94686_c0_g1_i1:117-926(+)
MMKNLMVLLFSVLSIMLIESLQGLGRGRDLLASAIDGSVREVTSADIDNLGSTEMKGFMRPSKAFLLSELDTASAGSRKAASGAFASDWLLYLEVAIILGGVAACIPISRSRLSSTAAPVVQPVQVTPLAEEGLPRANNARVEFANAPTQQEQQLRPTVILVPLRRAVGMAGEDDDVPSPIRHTYARMASFGSEAMHTAASNYSTDDEDDLADEEMAEEFEDEDADDMALCKSSSMKDFVSKASPTSSRSAFFPAQRAISEPGPYTPRD